MQHIVHLLETYGDLFYPIIFIWTFLEGETVVIFGGYAGFHDIVNPWLLLVSAWLGSFLGDQLYYFLGFRYGERLLARFPKARPKVGVALTLLCKYNVLFIMSFRFIYGVRNVSSFAVGLSGLPWVRFASLNFIAAGLWASSFVGAGYIFGHVSEEVLGKGAQAFGFTMLLIFILIIVLVMRMVSRTAKTHAAHGAGSAPLGVTRPIPVPAQAHAKSRSLSAVDRNEPRNVF
jgi:membrane protein DedA with SNARE-associated domain